MIDPNKRWLVEDARKEKQSVTSDWAPHGQMTIDGVIHREMRPVITGYGYLIEAFRSEWSQANSVVDQIFMSSLSPYAIRAWHAHSETTDRLFVISGRARIVLFDGREGSPTFNVINEFRVAPLRPALLVIPPRVWHGVQNIDAEPLILLNAVDTAYQYESPDHWKVPSDSPQIPYVFPNLR